MSKNPTPKMDALRAMREQRFARVEAEAAAPKAKAATPKAAAPKSAAPKSAAPKAAAPKAAKAGKAKKTAKSG